MNNPEVIITLVDTIDRLEHTRDCIATALYIGKRCKCGVQDLKDSVLKYRDSVWKENREY